MEKRPDGNAPAPDASSEKPPGDTSQPDALHPTGIFHPNQARTPTAADPEGHPQPAVQGYDLIEVLGRGGMGVVYKARDQRLKRLVALKMVLSGRHAGQNERRRFRSEAETVARLQHPNIVQIYDVGEQDGHPFLALEFVDGVDLTTHCGDEPQTPKFAAELLEAMARAMHYAHQKGIVHRDLKPGNVLLARTGDSSDTTHDDTMSLQTRSQKAAAQATAEATTKVISPDESGPAGSQDPGTFEQGQTTRASEPSTMSYAGVAGHLATSSGLVPKIADFGLAKQLDSDNELTTTGQILGTAAYMSPEQAAGNVHDIGPAADIYALGAVLYKLLTGRPPFQGPTPIETLRMVRHDEPVGPSQLQPRLSRDLETICLRCLQKEPARRYPTAGELADELRRFLNDEPILARPVGRIEKSARWCRRNPTVAALLSTCALLFVVGFVLVSWKWREAAQSNETLITRNADLAAARARITTQLEEVQRARQDAIDQRDAARIREAQWTLDQGLEACRNGNPAEGLNWLLSSLGTWPESAEAERALVRRNLASWIQRLPALTGIAEHPERVQAMAMDPAGQTFVTGDFAGIVRVWDVSTLEEKTRFGPLGRWINSIDVSPSGEHIVVAWGRPDGTDGGCGVWELETGTPLVNLVRNVGCYSCRFSNDGSRIATGTFHGKVHIREARSGAPVHEITAADQRVRALAFSPDDSILVTTAHIEGRSRTETWDMNTFQRIGDAWATDGAIVYSLTFAPNGERVAVGDTYGRVRFIDPRSGTPDGLTLGHSSAVSALAFTSDGRRLVAGCDFGPTLLWELPSGHRIAELPGRGSTADVAVDRDARKLITVHGDGTARVHQMPVTLAKTLPDPDPDRKVTIGEKMGDPVVVFDPKHRRVITATNHGEGTVRVWDLRTGLPVGPPLLHDWNTIRTMAINDDGTRLAVGGYQTQAGLTGYLRIWNLQTFEPVGPTILHSNYVACLDFHPDGRRLAAGDYHNYIRVWDVETGMQDGEPMLHDDIVLQVAFADRHRLISTTAQDHSGGARLWSWDFGTRQSTGRSERHRGNVHYLRLSPDGRTALTSATGDVARLWSIDPLEPTGRPLELQQDFADAEFSPDGRWVAIGSRDGWVRLFAAEDGTPFAHTFRTDRAVRRLAFDASGNKMLVGCADGSSWLWDVKVGRPLAAPFAQSHGIIGVGFSADTGEPWSVDADEAVRLWSVPAPLEAPLEALRVEIPLITRHQMIDAGAMLPLTARQWQADQANRKKPWSVLPSSSRLLGWHQAGARLAETDRDGFAAAWHLARLIEQNPNNWMLAARRARALVWSDRQPDADEAHAAAAKYAADADATGEFQDWLRHALVEARRQSDWERSDQLLARMDIEDDWRMLVIRARIHAELNRPEQQAADLRKATETADDAGFLLARIGDMANAGQWQEIHEIYGRVTRLAPMQLTDWHNYALVMLRTGDVESYRSTCQRLYDQLSARPLDAGTTNLLCWICAIGPVDAELARQASQMLEPIISTIPEDAADTRYAFLNTLGVLLYRAERFDDAEQRLKEGIAATGTGGTVDYLVLAAIAHRRGNADEAARWLAKADETKEAPGDAFSGLELSVLRTELNELIESADGSE